MFVYYTRAFHEIQKQHLSCAEHLFVVKLCLSSAVADVNHRKSFIDCLQKVRKWYVSNALKLEVSISLRDSTTSLLVLRDLWPTTLVFSPLVYHFLSQLDTTYQALQGINAL